MNSKSIFSILICIVVNWFLPISIHAQTLNPGVFTFRTVSPDYDNLTTIVKVSENVIFKDARQTEGVSWEKYAIEGESFLPYYIVDLQSKLEFTCDTNFNCYVKDLTCHYDSLYQHSEKPNSFITEHHHAGRYEHPDLPEEHQNRYVSKTFYMMEMCEDIEIHHSTKFTAAGLSTELGKVVCKSYFLGVDSDFPDINSSFSERNDDPVVWKEFVGFQPQDISDDDLLNPIRVVRIEHKDD